ncbi:MAG TPA: type III polyketide synthase [Polyangia bacterium]|jgi:predicted naringenin-chalcone synthase
MGKIAATATAVPSFRLDRDTFKRYCELVFSSPLQKRAARRIVDNTRIDARYLVATPDEILAPRSLQEKSVAYAKHARELGEHVGRRALDRAHVAADAVDMIVTTSCTGVMIPSVDAYLVEQMRMRRDVVRLPITELGCAAGAASLARAREHLRANPDHTVLCMSIELPSLTFQKEDLSMTNLVAASIFGDGAAACVVRGVRAPGGVSRPGPTLIDSMCHLYPESQYLMGFELKDGGFHIVLDRDVPHALKGRVRPLVEQLCARNGITIEDLAFSALHPGGRRILEDLDADLGLGGLTEPSWDVLRDYGNLSSATVLFVLDEVLRRAPPPTGSYGLLAAFGPGFSAELSLMRWQ